MTRGSRLVLAGCCFGLLAGASQAKTIVVARDVAANANPLLHAGAGPLAHAASVPYGGGPVLHANRTHLIFWQPSGSGLAFDPGYISLFERLLHDVAVDSRRPTNIFGLSGQFTDEQGPATYNSSYGGAVIATDPLPSNACIEPIGTGPGWTDCVNDSQIQAEIEHVIASDHLPTSMNDVYFLVTPSGLGSCTVDNRMGQSAQCALGGRATGYCGYHTTTVDTSLIYAVIPYNAVAGHCDSGQPRPNSSTADPGLSTVAHEQLEIVTDPFGNAWIDQSGNEIADVCIGKYGPGLGGSGNGQWDQVINGDIYWLQEIWSNRKGACEPRPAPDFASFGAPAHPRARRATAFLAHARDPGGAIVSYSWHFGDGHTGSRRSPKHTYARPGSYRVVLRVTDSAGNWAFYARTVRVSKAIGARGKRA